MWYVVLCEAVALAVLWGAWLHKRTLLNTTLATLKTLLNKSAVDIATSVDTISRHKTEIAALRKELAATYEVLNALSTPASVRDDLNRLLSR